MFNVVLVVERVFGDASGSSCFGFRVVFRGLGVRLLFIIFDLKGEWSCRKLGVRMEWFS